MTDFQATPPDIAAPRVPHRARIKRQHDLLTMVAAVFVCGFIFGYLAGS